MALVLQSPTPEDTLLWGEKIGRKLFPGAVIALIGTLGSGKTVLTKGIAKGLGVEDTHYVTSPTFTIINQYCGRLPIYHLDLYRLDKEEMESVGYREYFYGDGVAIIEWADLIEELLPLELLRLEIRFGSEDGRQIIAEGRGDRYKRVQEEIGTSENSRD